MLHVSVVQVSRSSYTLKIRRAREVGGWEIVLPHNALHVPGQNHSNRNQFSRFISAECLHSPAYPFSCASSRPRAGAPLACARANALARAAGRTPAVIRRSTAPRRHPLSIRSASAPLLRSWVRIFMEHYKDYLVIAPLASHPPSRLTRIYHLPLPPPTPSRLLLYKANRSLKCTHVVYYLRFFVKNSTIDL